jgi:hypothetical protein
MRSAKLCAFSLDYSCRTAGERGPLSSGSVPVRTLVSLCSTQFYKRRNQRDTSHSLVLVLALDLTFLRRSRGTAGRNVKSATPV